MYIYTICIYIYDVDIYTQMELVARGSRFIYIHANIENKFTYIYIYGSIQAGGLDARVIYVCIYAYI
jgi:hypothetical protein